MVMSYFAKYCKNFKSYNILSYLSIIDILAVFFNFDEISLFRKNEYVFKC